MNAEIREYLPLLIPLIIAQFSLLGYAIFHILTHENYKRGSRVMWLLITICFTGFIGPILYLTIGKEEE